MSAERERGASKWEQTFDTIVVGGGQAGLAAGYHLARQGVNFTILDREAHAGDAWRKRYESLRLFTPSPVDGLPGMPFPGEEDHFPVRDEVADYLENYELNLNLPVRHNVEVWDLSRDGEGYHLFTGAANMRAAHVIVATGPLQLPRIPDFAGGLEEHTFQLHTRDYRNPQWIPARDILVVGAGNSGVDVALELARTGRRVWLSGKEMGRRSANPSLGGLFSDRLVVWFMGNVMEVNSPLGRKMKPGVLQHGGSLGRVHRSEVTSSGVQFMPATTGSLQGKPEVEGGQRLPVDGVIWATGFQPNYRWIHLPVFDEAGWPMHWRGVVPGAPGLYFVGLHFQSALNSSLLGGVGRDAAYIVDQIVREEGAAQ